METASSKRGELELELPFPESSLCAKHLRSVPGLIPSPDVLVPELASSTAQRAGTHQGYTAGAWWRLVLNPGLLCTVGTQGRMKEVPSEPQGRGGGGRGAGRGRSRFSGLVLPPGTTDDNAPSSAGMCPGGQGAHPCATSLMPTGLVVPIKTISHSHWAVLFAY